MKKSLILALSLAAPVFAGEPVMAPPTVIAPAPSPWSVEVAAGYNWAMGDIFDGGVSKSIDVYSADITGVYTIDANHSVNLRFGYSFGDECCRVWGMEDEVDVHTFSIMPGYRYTHAIDEKLSVFAGVNVGVANVSVKEKVFDDFESHDSEWGFAWSLEVGAKYKMSDNWSAFATWGLSGNTAEPATWDGHRPIDQQWYHGIRVGATYAF